MSDIVRVEYYIYTNKVGSKCSDVVEFEKEEWDSMTDDERDESMQQCAFNEMEWGFKVLDGDES